MARSGSGAALSQPLRAGYRGPSRLGASSSRPLYTGSAPAPTRRTREAKLPAQCSQLSHAPPASSSEQRAGSRRAGPRPWHDKGVEPRPTERPESACSRVGNRRVAGAASPSTPGSGPRLVAGLAPCSAGPRAAPEGARGDANDRSRMHPGRWRMPRVNSRTEAKPEARAAAASPSSPATEAHGDGSLAPGRGWRAETTAIRAAMVHSARIEAPAFRSAAAVGSIPKLCSTNAPVRRKPAASSSAGPSSASKSSAELSSSAAELAPSPSLSRLSGMRKSGLCAPLRSLPHGAAARPLADGATTSPSSPRACNRRPGGDAGGCGAPGPPNLANDGDSHRVEAPFLPSSSRRLLSIAPDAPGAAVAPSWAASLGGSCAFWGRCGQRSSSVATDALAWACLAPVGRLRTTPGRRSTLTRDANAADAQRDPPITQQGCSTSCTSPAERANRARVTLLLATATGDAGPWPPA